MSNVDSLRRGDGRVHRLCGGTLWVWVWALAVPASAAPRIDPDSTLGAAPESTAKAANDEPETSATEIDELMFSAASHVRAGQVEEAIELAVRAMSLAMRTDDVAGEQRIAVLVARWSWEAYLASGDTEHLERAERSVAGVSESAEDPRVLEMAGDVRTLIAAEQERLAAERSSAEQRALEMGGGPRASVSRVPDSKPARRVSRARSDVALVASGAVALAGAIGLLAAGGAFFRGLPQDRRVEADRACLNCRELGVGYTIGGAALAAGSAALLGVGIRRLMRSRHGRAQAWTRPLSGRMGEHW